MSQETEWANGYLHFAVKVLFFSTSKSMFLVLFFTGRPHEVLSNICKHVGGGKGRGGLAIFRNFTILFFQERNKVMEKIIDRIEYSCKRSVFRCSLEMYFDVKLVSRVLRTEITGRKILG